VNALELRIKELRLRGVAPGQRASVRRAIERELARLVREEGTPRSIVWGRRLAPRPLTRIETGPNAKPDEIAARVARQIYRGLGEGSSGPGTGGHHVRD